MPEAHGRGTHRARRRVSGNWILESWNCCTLTRLVMAAGTVAVLIICRQGERTRWRDAISCKRRVVSDRARYGDTVNTEIQQYKGHSASCTGNAATLSI